MNELNLIVLAGGSASRFAPLSNKSMFKFAGESLLAKQLKFFTSFGIQNITVIVNPDLESEMQAEVSKLELANARIKILAQVGEGQSGAVLTALRYINQKDSDVLIINLNDIFETRLFEDFRALLPDLRNHQQNMLTGYRVDKYFPGGYLLLDESEKYVINVIEKPGEGNEPSDLVRLVFDYFRNVGELESALSATVSKADDVYEVCLSNMMQNDTAFILLPYQGIWKFLKYSWHTFELMNYYLGKISGQHVADNVFVHPTAVLGENVQIESGAKIFANAVVNNSYIGQGTIVGNNALVRDSMVGAKSVIGMNSEVARSFLADMVWLHMNYIGDSLIDQNVALGSGSLTANFRLDEGNIKLTVKGEKIDTGLNKLGAVIGPNVRIGVGTQLMPGITIGSNSVIGPGLTVNQDIAAGKFVRAKQELQISDNNTDIAGLVRNVDKVK